MSYHITCSEERKQPRPSRKLTDTWQVKWWWTMAGRCSKFLRSWLMVFFADWLARFGTLYAKQDLHIPDSPRSKQRVAVSDTARRFAAKLGAAGSPSSWWAVQDALNGVIELANMKSISGGGYHEKSCTYGIQYRIYMDEKVAIFCFQTCQVPFQLLSLWHYHGFTCWYDCQATCMGELLSFGAKIWLRFGPMGVEGNCRMAWEVELAGIANKWWYQVSRKRCLPTKADLFHFFSAWGETRVLWKVGKSRCPQISCGTKLDSSHIETARSHNPNT